MEIISENIVISAFKALHPNIFARKCLDNTLFILERERYSWQIRNNLLRAHIRAIPIYICNHSAAPLRCRIIHPRIRLVVPVHFSYILFNNL
jgi:hypothetical protein